VPEAWWAELELDWERIWKDCQHTLGNLTLTEYNSEYSNRSFRENVTWKEALKAHSS
jgi:hypothetical protein